MENTYSLYQNYIQGVRCAYGISFPFLSFNKWLEEHGIMRNPGEFKEPNFQDSSFPRTDDNSSVSSATSATSLPSSDNSKKPDTNRWIKPQTDMLVSLWQENTGVLKSTRSHKMCVKIKAAVDNLGPAKTIKHCKDKMRNLKDSYKRAKENIKRLVLRQVFHPTVLKLTKFLDVEMLCVYQKKTEVGANSISDDEILSKGDIGKRSQ